MAHSYELRGIYAITDGSIGNDLFTKVEQALQGGIGVLQYRDKTSDSSRRLAEANTLRELCNDFAIPLIINDDVQLAVDANAAGVHLGIDDGSIYQARQQLGADSIIGVSCYNELTQARAAEEAGADYVAFGSFFPSPTKPNAPRANATTLRTAKSQLTTPVCCIGGITLDNAHLLLTEAPEMLAVISAIFSSSDITGSTHTFAKLFQQ